MQLKIGIQGVRGSFNDIAARHYYQERAIEIVELISSEQVMKALVNNKINFGVCAIENSIGGIVAETQQALLQYATQEIARFVLPILQCLMAKTDFPLNEITDVHSHIQALKQCAHFLKTHCEKASLIAEEDTALCARLLSQGHFAAHSAVIASRLCVKEYGLVMLAENIQDRADNQTTFGIYEKRI